MPQGMADHRSATESISATLAADDVDDTARGVDLAGLEVDDLPEAQPAVIHEDAAEISDTSYEIL